MQRVHSSNDESFAATYTTVFTHKEEEREWERDRYKETRTRTRTRTLIQSLPSSPKKKDEPQTHTTCKNE